MAKNFLIHAPVYGKYIDLVKLDDLQPAFAAQSVQMRDFLAGVPESRGSHAYAEGKWTVKQLLQHMADCERVFAYRALRFARRDQTPLPGFEENDWAAAACTNRSVQEIAAELLSIRRSSELLFGSFSEADLQRTGVANGHPVSVASIGWIILGHFDHHRNILQERYL
jgi:uncharacterized damage-inducible protein DinB